MTDRADRFQFTPGPWQWLWLDGQMLIVGARSNIIARVADLPFSSGEYEANMLLLAAAPSLLTALIPLVFPGGVPRRIGDIAMERQRARRAIFEAIGRMHL